VSLRGSQPSGGERPPPPPPSYHAQDLYSLDLEWWIHTKETRLVTDFLQENRVQVGVEDLCTEDDFVLLEVRFTDTC
jgi:hypothetical protein